MKDKSTSNILLRGFKELFFKYPNKKIEKRVDIFIYFIISLFSIIYAFMSVNNHRLFETSGWDLAVFDHGIWQWSQFTIPYSSFHDLPWLADHFHLILVFIAPLYWLWSDVRVLLIIQGIIVSWGALPIYYLSKRITKHLPFSITIVLGYLLFYSLQWHVFSDFHELTFLPIALGGMLYYWETKKRKLYWVFFAFTLLIKEELGFLLAAVGIWQLLNNNKRWKEASLTMLGGLLSTILLIYWVMPAIGGGAYRHLDYGQAGNTPLQVLEKILVDPLFFFKAFLDSPVKLNTIFTAYWPWGFLPLLSPLTLIPALEQFASRFLDYGKTIRWTPYFAYSLPIAFLTAWSSLYGFNNFLKIFGKLTNRRISKYTLGSFLSLAIILLIICEDIFLHAPINSLFKKAYYRTENWMIDNNKIISCVPKDVSLSAQNNLAPYLSQRKQIKVFPEGLKEGYEYLAVDFHPGQSENSFHFLGSKNSKYLIDDLVGRRLYKIVCKENNALVLKKIDDTKDMLNYSFPIEIYER